MKRWIEQDDSKRKQLIIQTSQVTGYSPEAIEKDWYVTMALQTVFKTEWAPHIVFKGGTSLSKGWGLITRFSEDVDLAIDPVVLGMPVENISSSGDIKKLRKASKVFMEGPFVSALASLIREAGIPEAAISVTVQPVHNSDADPRIIELEYPTLFPSGSYIRSRVLLEVGARSLKEPYTARPIASLMSQHFPNHSTAVTPFEVATVNPERTFLEKMFLLHEEFTKPEEKRRYERLSRHLYDIDKIKDTDHGRRAITDNMLFSTIRTHRGIFNAYDHVDYKTISLGELIIVPPAEVIGNWKEDYRLMKESMFGDDAPEFGQVIANLTALHESIKQ
jgi:hypothetical protein